MSLSQAFLPGTSLEPAVIPTAQASSFTLLYFPYLCDVPSIAVFCSESIECFPGIVSKFFFKLLVTIPVAPIITGTILHFRFHIRCIAIHKLLYFNFFSASFCTPFLSAVLPHLSVCMCSLFLFFNYYIWPICCNSSVCVYCYYTTTTLLLLIIIIIIIIIIIVRNTFPFLKIIVFTSLTRLVL